MESTEPSVGFTRTGATKAASVLRILANEDRIRLLCHISRGEKCVGELEALLDLHQPTLSQQLGVLRNEGLVNTRRDGKRIYYSMADEKALAVLQTLCGLYGQEPEENP